MKDIFEERNQHLNQQCQDLAERNQFPEMLFGLKERFLAWCPVPKSGTSTWITYLMELSSKSKIEKHKLYEYYKPIGLDLALKITTQLSKKSWKYWVTSLELKHQKPVKFIVVRNPFDRLVSAFRDRIERESWTRRLGSVRRERRRRGALRGGGGVQRPALLQVHLLHGLRPGPHRLFPPHLQLLPAHLVGLWPVLVVLSTKSNHVSKK